MNFHNEALFSYLGPPLSQGPLPSLFYFSLSGKASLTLDPFNQPAAYLSQYPMRIFSLDLPGHENDLDPLKAIGTWARSLQEGTNIIAASVDKIAGVVKELQQRHLLIPKKTAVAGLSRGGFMACHAAAQIPLLNPILNFAPLSRLSLLKEFDLFPYTSLDLIHLTDALYDRKMRTYIGNRDTCVGTGACFEFIQALTEKAHEKRIRSPQIEMIITPSIGHQGHGTSKEIFQEGAEWLWRHLQ